MIELATIAKERTYRVKKGIATKVLKEEIDLEDSIDKSIKHGMNFTYVDARILVHSIAFVKEALEIFGYTVKEVTNNGNKELKVEW